MNYYIIIFDKKNKNFFVYFPAAPAIQLKLISIITHTNKRLHNTSPAKMVRIFGWKKQTKLCWLKMIIIIINIDQYTRHVSLLKII